MAPAGQLDMAPPGQLPGTIRQQACPPGHTLMQHPSGQIIAVPFGHSVMQGANGEMYFTLTQQQSPSPMMMASTDQPAPMMVKPELLYL